jgi:hypothetical protein
VEPIDGLQRLSNIAPEIYQPGSLHLFMSTAKAALVEQINKRHLRGFRRAEEPSTRISA